MDRFIELRNAQPKLRLAQFIGNFWSHNPDPYYLNDSVFLDRLEAFYNQEQPEQAVMSPVDREVIESALSWAESQISYYRRHPEAMEANPESYEAYVQNADTYRNMLETR